MKIRFLLAVTAVFLCVNVYAQKPNELTQSRILILLDESSSMTNSWVKDEQRVKAADELIIKLMDSVYAVNDQVEFSLRAFGHQYPAQENNCYDTKNEVMFSKDNRTQMALRLADLHPYGVTPIAYSLEQAAEQDMVDEQHYVYSIVLITDGGESCGGDICDVVKRLIDKKVYFKPYVVSLVDDPTLKTQYSCLGNFLQVTQKSDIPVAVGSIVEAYRPMITMSKLDYKQLQSIIANSPSVLKSNIPAFKVPESDFKKTPDTPKKEPVAEVKPPVTQPVVVKTTPPVTKTEVKKPPVVKPEVKPEPKPEVKQTPKTAPVTDTTMHAVRTFKSHIEVGDGMPKEPTVRIKPRQIRKMPILYALQDDPVKPVRVPPMPVIKNEPVKTATFHGNNVTDAPKDSVKMIVKVTPTTKPPVTKPVTTTKPVVKKQEPPKEMQVTEQQEDNKETTLEIYITNGKGKFYNSTPQINLIDPATGQVIKKFYRTTDAAGNPDPQENIPPGKYNLTVTGKNRIAHIVVEGKKKNKVTLLAQQASVKFSYEGNPNRPVTEYDAVVVQRNTPSGKIVNQKCTAEVQYEPGNYFVQINTLPVMRRNVDLDFDSEWEWQIPEPGFVQFTNKNNVGNVALYQVIGDSYGQFHTVAVNGTTSDQKLMLLPGPYQAKYIKDPKMPYPKEIVVPFSVKSNQVSEVELKEN